ncbi:MAG: AAA family ATPase [Candidatus Rokubacteria bacterium]|nr:AAA family ATPase [Candidatus Rokubacteria bacterium]
MYLAGIRRAGRRSPGSGFPWSLPLFRDLRALDLESPVTFLVGENGSGKSTLLEGLALGVRAVAVGRRDLERDETLAGARALARGFRFLRPKVPRVAMFLRAEDVFGFTRRIAQDMADLGDMEAELRRALPDGSYGQSLATGVVRGQRRALAERYGEDPDARSHGETFLGLLQARLVPRGLYFLDEPETPLSPTRVLALIALVMDRTARDCQFVIATHSPILMACPGAQILLLEEGRVRRVAYQDLEHVQITKAFLDDPESFLRRL